MTTECQVMIVVAIWATLTLAGAVISWWRFLKNGLQSAKADLTGWCVVVCMTASFCMAWFAVFLHLCHSLHLVDISRRIWLISLLMFSLPITILRFWFRDILPEFMKKPSRSPVLFEIGKTEIRLIDIYLWVVVNVGIIGWIVMSW